MRKKILLLVAACTMAVSMAGCGSKEATLKSDKTKQAVSESVTVEDKEDKSDSSNKVEMNNEKDDNNKADDSGKADKNSRNDRNTKSSENKDDDLDNFDDEDIDDDIDEDLDEDIEDKSDNTTKASRDSSSIIGSLDENNDVYYLTGDLIKDSTKGDTVLYTNEDGTEKLAVTVLRNQPYTDEEVYDICMEQIKSVYGENYDISCYSTDDYFFDEYDFLEGNDNDDYSDVKVYLYTDGETIIIIEHGVLHGAGFPSTAEDLIDSLVIV